MNAKKAVSLLLLCAMMLSGFSIESSYSLTIHAYDSSLRGAQTYVEIPGRDPADPYSDISIPDGETITLNGYASCIIRSRAESGWYRWPTKATRSIKVSPRDQLPAIITGNAISTSSNTRKRSTEDKPEAALNTTTNPMSKKIVMVDLTYPYEKKQIYLNSSLVTVAGQFMAMGYQVEIVDLNIDDLADESIRDKFRRADMIGVSVIGAPYIPNAIKLAQNLPAITKAPIIMGGQVVENLAPSQFATIFAGTKAIQFQNEKILALQLGINPADIPNAYSISLIPVFEAMEPERLAIYLRHEMALVLSQGCKYNCDFCAARKARKEQFRNHDVFESDLRYLAKQAKTMGLEKLEFYASSLDAFQNPKTFAENLEILSKIQAEEKIEIKVRCLSCAKSFLEAFDQVPNLAELIHKAGLWCVGFGGDGVDEKVWKAQNKWQNTEENIRQAIARCQQIGIRPELLLVLGFEEENLFTLGKTLVQSIYYSLRWNRLVLRPYLAKDIVPGNKEWENPDNQVRVAGMTGDLFYNLDFCAVASKTSHPQRWWRWACNFTYLAIIIVMSPFGRCATSPLLPQGSGGIYGRLAKFVNRHMPFDR